ncbi:group I intron-associated PD-(D/E)XK endonuclease [Mycolicibacterium iranicum]|uniref:group I intron-associated PD-(D/E)XK endonuclease n=1 Tax=Mycolicibacterium iranicum TaxID=912594 RepID=UPI003AF32444
MQRAWTKTLVCIYCPDTDACYYVNPSAHGFGVTLRITPSKNRQQVGVFDAAAFRELRPRKSADPLSKHHAR